MPDFTLNAPGTTNNPWTPANVIIPASTISSNATGFHAGVNGTNVTFAHNATYGTSITSTVTLATAGATGDDIIAGAGVRSGANAGAMIGVIFYSAASGGGCRVCTSTGAGTVTTISGPATYTRTLGDVLSVTVAISGGTATVTASANGTALVFSVNTTTTYATESSLAAGAQFQPQDVNGLYLSQFTGTGVAGSIRPSQFFLGANFLPLFPLLPLGWVIGRRRKLAGRA
jgi:hypothetical protein